MAVGERVVMAPSEREQLALKTVRRYMWWATGAALIPIPFLDIAAVLGAQLKMIAELSKIYDIPFERSNVQAGVGSLLGYILPESLSEGLFGSLLKTIPGLGGLVGIPSFAVFVAGYVWALGRVFIMHFESGGTLLDFDPGAVREHFRAQFEEGRKMAADMKNGPNAVA
jgi:uncharacterized protein (DUF697 family)